MYRASFVFKGMEQIRHKDGFYGVMTAYGVGFSLTGKKKHYLCHDEYLVLHLSIIIR